MDRKKAKISKVNDRSLYGKTPLESWTGTVVSYDAQKDQLEGGWGWRYKVRIMGENTQSDTITSEKIDYAYCLLPTTAGSGGAYKLRSVRISQGDYVFGVKGGGGPTIIMGVFPRTSKQVPALNFSAATLCSRQIHLPQSVNHIRTFLSANDGPLTAQNMRLMLRYLSLSSQQEVPFSKKV